MPQPSSQPADLIRSREPDAILQYALSNLEALNRAWWEAFDDEIRHQFSTEAGHDRALALWDAARFISTAVLMSGSDSVLDEVSRFFASYHVPDAISLGEQLQLSPDTESNLRAYLEADDDLMKIFLQIRSYIATPVIAAQFESLVAFFEGIRTWLDANFFERLAVHITEVEGRDKEAARRCFIVGTLAGAFLVVSEDMALTRFAVAFVERLPELRYSAVP
jgi:hypothetical protein